MFGFLGKFFDANKKTLAKITPFVEKINSLEASMQKLSEEDFPKMTGQLKTRLSSGETLDDILPEAFALVREAARRKLGERHFDVQLIAAIVLHKGAVAEQKTGEGKTLSSIPALYLNALTGRGVHLVTVNDYLARRDCGWMGPVFHLLGVSVAAIIHDQSFLYDETHTDKATTDWRLQHLKPISRKEAYAADITYGINSEFGFDYLRDNMVSDKTQMVQRGFHFAIVDEVDSVLIDEARTPHIISAPDTEPTEKYYEYAKIVARLESEKDFSIDEKMHTAHLTEEGLAKVEQMLGVSDIYEKDFLTVHHIEAALKAQTLFKNDKEYVVKDGQVVIVDEFTGRMLHGRRFSEGLHQAIEAKEGVRIQQESKTLATVSLQNYFRGYEKLAGMTGTAATEAEEFHKIYKLDVVIIPTHRPVVRHDKPDMVYKTIAAKFNAVIEEIAACHKKGQPVLVGTTSIEKNELLGKLLAQKGIPFELLNAKNHQKEADIIANAGKKGAVTIATNMAGRGVDIVLGGVPDTAGDTKAWKKHHDEVIAVGGLHVIGTERHESRRIDNQLRGRSGRQGDPGSTRFYVALDDDIMRLFGGEQVAKLMTIFKLPDDVPLEHGMVSRAIEQAQVKVEGFHFDTRKHLVEYDDVLNKQREIIYGLRHRVLADGNIRELIQEKLQQRIALVGSLFSSSHLDNHQQEQILAEITAFLPLDPPSVAVVKEILAQGNSQKLITGLTQTVDVIYAQRQKDLGEEVLSQVEKWVVLSVIDTFWMNHLTAIDDLREGIGLRGYGQLDPLVEYKNEAFSMFERLLTGIDNEITERIFRVQVQFSADQLKELERRQKTAMQNEVEATRTRQQQKSQLPGNVGKKLGRNDPCPCGSGKKWKKCHYPNMP